MDALAGAQPDALIGPLSDEELAALDGERNRAATGDAELSEPGAPVRTVVVTARGDLEIRRHVLDVLT